MPPPQALRTAYILGAGASAQFDEGITPVPVTRTFMKAAHDLMIGDFMDVWEFLLYLYGPKFDEANINIEEVLSVVDFGRTRPEGVGKKYSRARLDVLHERLLEMVWRTLRTSLQGNPCSKHAALVSRMGTSDSILSFNWDILIDNALSFAPGGHFDAACGYGFDPTGIEAIKGTWLSTRCEHQEDSSRRRLFKMHGSMNWLKCPECDAVYIRKGRKATYPVEAGISSCKADGQVLQPMIVPFTWAKKFDLKPYTKIWRGARIALERAERIVVIGYSLPDADFHARDLLLRSACENSVLSRVDLVDIVFTTPATGIALREKFERVFRKRIPAEHCYPSIDALLGIPASRKSGDIV